MIAAVVLLSVLGAGPERGRAGMESQDRGVELLGAAREIPRTGSASRDAPVLALSVLPRVSYSAGASFSLLSFSLGQMRWRLGLAGLVEIDGEDPPVRILPLGGATESSWRGQYGFAAAVSLDPIADAICGPSCDFEVALSGTREIEGGHDAVSTRILPDPRASSMVGDFLMIDVAGRAREGRLELVGRVQHKVFLPDRSAYSAGPGADLVARWRLFEHVHPFTSVHAEILFGRGSVEDRYTVRNLTGVILTSDYGDMYVYGSADVGRRKGPRVLTEEKSIGGGLRIAFF